MADAAAAALLTWLRASGGLVHEALAVSRTGAGRGLVATRAIASPGPPLIAVPATLLLTPSTAAAALAAHHAAPPSVGPAVAALDPSAPLALLLALEMGPDVPTPSPWGLYARSLPPAAPAGWALPPADLRAALDAARVPSADRPAWTAAVSASRTRAAALADRIAAVAGDAGLPRPPPPASIGWALAHVVSRAFRCSPGGGGGGGGGPALLPVIDLANHAAGAADPAWATSPGAPHPYATLRPASGRGRTPASLSPGDELCTSYTTGQGAGGPLEWFLNYGFVPPEAWGGKRRRRGG